MVSQQGFECVSIDFEGNKLKPYVHVIKLDLRERGTWEFLEHLVITRRVFHFHGAPPYGTALVARHRRGTEPHLLRSNTCPYGLPDLPSDQQKRVDSANAIYMQMALFCKWLTSLGIGWSIENPGNSFLWMLDEYLELAGTSTYYVYFHSCVHGGDSQKFTALLTNREELRALSGFCDQSHTHVDWGLFRDAGDVLFAQRRTLAYPKLLCERFALVLAMAAWQQGFLIHNLNRQECSGYDARVAAGRQPRGAKVLPLIAEFKTVVTIQVPAADAPLLDDKRLLQQKFHTIPVGSKLLRASPAKRGVPGSDERVCSLVFGVYRNMFDFVKEATLLDHPFDSFRAVPDSMLYVIFNHLVQGPVAIMKQRIAQLEKWKSSAAELDQAERRLHAGMDPGCSAVLKGKRLLLLEKIANEISWPDKCLHRELREGFRLVGLQQPSGVFPADVKPRMYDENALMKQSTFTKLALWQKIQKAPPADFEQELWDITQTELREKQWLEGPYSFEELEVKFNSCWLPVRRFAVFQRGKWRPIDDFTEAGTNGAFGSVERIDLRALDEIVWSCACLIRILRMRGAVEIQLSSGELLQGELHSFWRRSPAACELMIKTLDLKSAYKQLAISPLDRPKAVLVLRCPKTKNCFGYICKTLPFGSTASVLHFNRVSRLIHQIGIRLNIVWGNYFDDYPVVEMKTLCSSADSCLHVLLDLLGFECSKDKEEPFKSKADLLGVRVDVSDSMAHGRLQVGNKPSRMEELLQAVDQILERRTVEPRTLPSLFGRALFVESHLFGRAGKLAMADLRELERKRSTSVKLEDLHVDAFEILRGRYAKAEPRSIDASPKTKPVLVFTDAACEFEGGKAIVTVGGVLITEFEVRAFSGILPQALISQWEACGKKHYITQAELYAVCAARLVWKVFLDGLRSVWFVDNSGALGSCIKAHSSDVWMRKLLCYFEKFDQDNPTIAWYTRVPSTSNVGDLPSRGKWSKLSEMFNFQVDHVKCFVTGKWLDQVPEK